MNDPDCVCQGTGKVIQGSSGEATPCPYCCDDALNRVDELRVRLDRLSVRFDEAVNCADIVCRIIEVRAKLGGKNEHDKSIEIVALGDALKALNEHRRSVGEARGEADAELDALKTELGIK